MFVGANKQSFSVDYNSAQSLVAYGAGTNIALWNPTDPNHKGVSYTLKNHSQEVTCVRFVPDGEFLISCAEDHNINIWQKSDLVPYKLVQTINAHSGSITCIAVLNSNLFATGSSDGQIKLWHKVDPAAWKEVHSEQIKPGFYPLSLALQDISSDKVLLSVGGTNFNLYIYSFILSAGQVSDFTQAAVLTGHEDWIKCLSFIKESPDNYLLASGSQDRYIRLWRLRLNEQIDNSDEDSSKLILLSNKQYKFNIQDTKAAFSFEALIMGHDDWVTGLAWHPSASSNKTLQLLSSSADTALMIWEMDHESGIWVCVSRLGELSIKGASTATGASGGFWSCNWFVKDGEQYILTNGKTGSIRAYKSDNSTNWDAILSVTGPCKEITDLKWSKGGDYFMATSLDQTTRLLAPWSVNKPVVTWHEFARPQIHGYDMICLDNISSTKFVSGGDEKILRVFEMTDSISKLLKNFSGVNVDTNDTLPETAALPVLGLSNKAANEQLEAGEAAQQQQDAEENQEPTEPKKEDFLTGLTTPPLEDHLQRFTLFPELEKLYGHGYEITSCVVSPNGALIASACKSNSTKHGMLRIFNVNNDYQQCDQTLPGHNLTVTNIEFSPSGQYLVSVSRDRQFILWKVTDEEKGTFEMVENNPKAHTRIIWDCDWVPTNSYGDFFATVGRDKHIKLWNITEKVNLAASLKLEEVVTAITCYKYLLESKVLIAIGTEAGALQLFTVDLSSDVKEFTLLHKVDSSITPAAKVSKMKFSHKQGAIMLAVGSGDTSIRLYNIDV